MDRFNSKLNTTGEKSSELETRAIEITQNGTRTLKR